MVKPLTYEQIIEKWSGFGLPTLRDKETLGIEVNNGYFEMDDMSQDLLDEDEDWYGIFNNTNDLFDFVQNILSNDAKCKVKIHCENDSTDCTETDVYTVTKNEVKNTGHQSYNPDYDGEEED